MGHLSKTDRHHGSNRARPCVGRRFSEPPLLVYVNNDMLVASPDVVQLQRAAARMQQSSGGTFIEHSLPAVVHSYRQGAGWLFCADMEQIVRTTY